MKTNTILMRLKNFYFLLLFVLLTLPFISYGQDYVMSNGGSISACEGTFLDPGGHGKYPGGSGTMTYTICNPTAGSPIYMHFLKFQLWRNGCIWGASIDRLKIYDGPSTGSPLLGTYQENDLHNKHITGNSGCLTFEFIKEDKGGTFCANNNGDIGWEATISCSAPSGSSENGETCVDAAPFCSDTQYLFPNAVNSNSPSGPNYGCLSTRPNPVWYYLKIATPGKLQLALGQKDYNGSGIDIDFAMWGPFNDVPSGCTQIMSGVYPIQCSYSPSATETIGIGMQGGSSGGQSIPPDAQVGDVYIILMTNFDESAGFITLSQTGGNGATDCSIVIPCRIDNISANPTACDATTNEYSITGQIEFHDAPSTGTLIIEDCNGNTTTLNPPFNSPMSYTISGVNADGATCQVTAYFSDETLCRGTSADFTAPSDCDCTPPDLTTNPLTICSGDNVDLNTAIDSSSDPANVSFYASQVDANGSNNPISNTVNTGGSYWVRAEDPNKNTCFAVYEITVTEIGVTIDDIDITNATCYQSCDGEIAVTASNGATPYTYSFKDNGGNEFGNGVAANVEGLCAGSYAVYVEDDLGCSAEGVATITEPDEEDPSFDFDDFCEGTPNGPTNIAEPGGSFTFNPIPTDGATINPSTGVISGETFGTTYSVEYTTGGNCPRTSIKEVTVNGFAISVSKNDATCDEDNGSITITNQGGQSPFIYSIDNGATNQSSNAFVDLSDDNYSIIVIDANGCESSTSTSIAQLGNIVPDFIGDNLEGCLPHTVNFEDLTNGDLTGASCLWDFGDGNTINQCGDVSHTYSQAGNYTVSLTITNDNDCGGVETKTDYVIVVDRPIASFVASPSTTDLSNTEINFTNTSSGATDYIWDFGDGTFDDETNPSHFFPNVDPGTYEVSLTASNDYCEDHTSTKVNIIYAEMEYELPNVFTPNGDGENDFFKFVYYENIVKIDLFIINRWGNKVFESDDVNFRWNGKVNNSGGDCSDGVYFYEMKITALNGDEESVNGYVHLSRGN